MLDGLDISIYVVITEKALFNQKQGNNYIERMRKEDVEG